MAPMGLSNSGLGAPLLPGDKISLPVKFGHGEEGYSCPYDQPEDVQGVAGLERKAGLEEEGVEVDAQGGKKDESGLRM